ALGSSEDLSIKLAVATSLATIIVTSLSSARSHQKRGTIDETLLRQWGPAVIIGVIIGTTLAGFAKGWVLTLTFGVIALLVAINMFLRSKSEPLRSGFPNRWVQAGAGIFVGLFSAMMGIGGGTLSVP